MAYQLLNSIKLVNPYHVVWRNVIQEADYEIISGVMRVDDPVAKLDYLCICKILQILAFAMANVADNV
jgi:hypothetical protein